MVLNLSAAASAVISFSGIAGSFSLYFVAGILPCLLWLLFYLRRDRHPEPKKEILMVFIIGALMTAPAVAIEVFLINTIDGFNLGATATAIISNIVAIAFIEEFAKYAAVWLKEQAVNQNRYLDEPVDFVIYMVVSALGFAAIENLLFLLPVVQEELAGGASFLQANSALYLMSLSLFRSISAILLHTLCSGIIGYYMAMTFCNREKKLNLLLTGFLTVSCLHGLYNFSIMKSESNLGFLLIPLAIILALAITLFVQFQKLLKLKSVCSIKTNTKRKAKSLK